MSIRLKRILYIAWLVLCTVAFIYFFVVLTKHTSVAVEQLEYYKVPNAAEIFPGMDIQAYIKSQTQGIVQNACLIVALAILYASFLALAIPKIVTLFRHELKTE